MATKSQESTSDAVGTLYDQFSDPLLDVMGGVIHVGYWDGPEDDRDMESATDRMTTIVGERLAVTGPGKHILDVGCGTGKPATQISAAHDVSVTGITISSHQVKVAQNNLKSGTQSEQVDFQLVDAMKMPFPDASFDGAYAIESLIHMEDQSTALEQIARVLRPGSRLVIADVFMDDTALEESDTQILEHLKEAFQAKTPPTATDYKTRLHQAGFKLVEFTDVRHNIERSHGLIVKGLREKDLSGNKGARETIDAVIAAMSKMHSLKQLAYAIITAERK